MANFKKYITTCRIEDGDGVIKKECITLINMEHVITCKVVKRFHDGSWTKVVRVILMNDVGYDLLVPEELQDDLVPDGLVLDRVLGL